VSDDFLRRYAAATPVGRGGTSAVPAATRGDTSGKAVQAAAARDKVRVS
jgi:hypothetical protein